MPLIIPHNTTCRCSCGTGLCKLIVMPDKQVFIDDLPVATIMDHKSGLNLPTFIMCTTAANPAVAANSGAPAPCVPVLPSPWTAGSVNVKIHDEIILHETSTLNCVYGGLISIEQPSQTTCDVPA
ncbi:DUF4280 domain-containing protein [Deltaproteobacteria bacterium Smac51]|nr:DUF4280 domain-containing protein [Deltaproteobacteria bacterium Smac51]